MSSALINDLVSPLGECFTAEVAAKVAGLRASPALEVRIHELGEKSAEGLLTPEERSEYETLASFVKFVSILQVQARGQMREPAAS